MIVVVSNDLLPGMGVPASAPGMRAVGLAAGLKDNGFETIITVPKHRMNQFPGVPGSGLTVPPGAIVLPYGKLRQFLDTVRPQATIICNSNYYEDIESADTGALVFDFFAPKILEGMAGGQNAEQLSQLKSRKLRALDKADLVIVNGKKKLAYAREWLSQSLSKKTFPPLEVVNMCFPWPTSEGNELTPGMSVVVAGYYQQWLDYGDKFSQLHDALESIPELHLTLLIPRLSQEVIDRTPQLGECLDHKRTRSVRAMLFEDYCRLIRRHDLFLDYFGETEERKLAMVTRSVVALGLGIPVIHPSFTEVSPIISRFDAGWIMEGAKERELFDLLVRLAQNPAELVERRSAAKVLSSTELSPKAATQSLALALRELT